MTRFALAVGLLLLVSYLASAQHQGTSSSSSSSSGGSSGGSSGSSSGGYSSGGGGGGGSYHSSGSSGGSSGNSGGSGSGGYSGAAHSSSSGSSPSSHSGGSGGSSSGSHSSTYSQPSPSSSGNTHNGGRENTPHSNIRFDGTQDARGSNSSRAGNVRGGGASNIAFQPLPAKTSPGPGDPDSLLDASWMHQPFHIAVPPQDLDKQTRQQLFADRVREVGLEPDKSSYRTAIASAGGQSRHVSWVGKLFGEKPSKTQHNVASEFRPCLGKECKPMPPQPKPCVGPKCPKPGPGPKPVPPPVGGVCTAGYRGPNGACQPWGYFERCSYPYSPNSLSRCRVQWASVDSSYCRQILEELYRQELRLRQTRSAQAMACSTPARSPECASLTQQINRILDRTQQLQNQYRMCSAAAGLNPPGTIATWPPDPWPSVSWPQVVWPWF